MGNFAAMVFRIRELRTRAHTRPCVLAKFPNSLCFLDRDFCSPYSLFSLCSGDPESRVHEDFEC